MRRVVVCLLAIVASMGAVLAQTAPAVVEVYQGPVATTYQSSFYTVEVLSNGVYLPSYVYAYGRISNTTWHQGAKPIISFTTFGTTSATTVRVTRIGRAITGVSVSPKSKRIPATITGGQAYVTLTTGDKAWITVNGDDTNPLMVFADGLKPAVPIGATYFGPGVRDMPATGNHYIPRDNETIYIDAGAWLRGNIDLRGRTGVKIMGPGVISGDLWTSESLANMSFDAQMNYTMIRGDWGARNATVEGVTIIASPTFNFYGGTHEARNVKLISPWYYSTDGFQAVNIVEDSFAFVGDDVFFPIWAGVANDDVRVSNSFAASTTNAVFCGGFWGNAPTNTYKAIVDNVDVRPYATDAWVPWGAPLTASVFQIWVDNPSSTYGYSNQTYQNIRIEGNSALPIAQLVNKPYPWAAQSYPLPLGNSYNLVFKNIAVNGTQKYRSEIKGFDANNGFHDVTLEKFYFGNTLVTPTNLSTYFDVNAFVSNLNYQAPTTTVTSDTTTATPATSDPGTTTTTSDPGTTTTTDPPVTSDPGTTTGPGTGKGKNK